ncbi:sodium-coupled monocarboxylate transporter 2-like [Ixodes scapularis]
MGILLAVVFAIVQGVMTLALIFWYRDCDPFLSGAIKSLDQLVPFYVKQNLSSFPGFSGVFLAGIVCATTSTISSIINNLAANCYVDIVARYISLNEHQAIRITTCLAFAIGTLMTAYSCLIPYLGSAARIFMMICSAVTGPFVALFMMALLFPFVNCKGAGVATLLMVAFEIWYILESLRHGVLPPRMQATLNNCPGNTSVATKAWNISAIASNKGPHDLFSRYRVSPYWSNFFSAIATAVLGLAISACTGGLKSSAKNIPFTSTAFLRLWRKIKIIRQDEITTVLSVMGDDKFSEEQKPEEEVMLGRKHETGI